MDPPASKHAQKKPEPYNRYVWFFLILLGGPCLYLCIRPIAAIPHGGTPQTRMAACRSNLKTIARALENYMIANKDDRLPPTLETMYTDYIKDLRVLRCPAKRYKDMKTSGYIWIPTRILTFNDEPARVLAYDRFPHTHEDPPTRSVLFTDLTVGTLTEEELQLRLAEELE